MVIHDVDADIPSTASFLGFVHDLFRSGFGTVALGPLFQLTGCSSAEPENLLPIRFKEEHDPSDGIFLIFPGISEACTVHMDMKSAGCRFMGEIPEIQGFIHYFSPGHPMMMVMKGHGVGDEFEAVFQTAVLLDVEVFLFAIGRITDRTGMVMIVSAFIDLQLHTEVAGIITVEDGLRFVAVVQDSAFRGVFLLKAVAAVEGTAIIGEGVAVLDDLTAVGADYVMLLVTFLADIGIPMHFTAEKDLTAAFALNGQPRMTAVAEPTVTDFIEFGQRQFTVAFITDKGKLFHAVFLLSQYSDAKSMVSTVSSRMIYTFSGRTGISGYSARYSGSSEK